MVFYVSFYDFQDNFANVAFSGYLEACDFFRQCIMFGFRHLMMNVRYSGDDEFWNGDEKNES